MSKIRTLFRMLYTDIEDAKGWLPLLFNEGEVMLMGLDTRNQSLMAVLLPERDTDVQT